MEPGGIADLHMEKVGNMGSFSKPRWSFFQGEPPKGAVSKKPFLVYKVLVYISKSVIDILYRCVAWGNICYIVYQVLKARPMNIVYWAEMHEFFLRWQKAFLKFLGKQLSIFEACCGFLFCLWKPNVLCFWISQGRQGLPMGSLLTIKTNIPGTSWDRLPPMPHPSCLNPAQTTGRGAAYAARQLPHHATCLLD